MIVTSTELQNNFGKYVALAGQEDIIITRNGNAIAKLTAIRGREALDDAEIVKEGAAKYSPESLGKATYEEFLALTRDSEERYEYIDGEIFLLASPKTAHQYALTELLGIFYGWFQGKPCQPFVAPYDIELKKAPDNMNVVQPDLMVICDLEEHLGEDDYYKGVPTLVIEILSESTRRKDMVKKLDLYMLTGVKEYWIVNPLNREVTVYALEDGDIRSSATYKGDESAQSFVFPGLRAEVGRIFR